MRHLIVRRNPGRARTIGVGAAAVTSKSVSIQGAARSSASPSAVGETFAVETHVQNMGVR